jgi:hypothetical protein
MHMKSFSYAVQVARQEKDSCGRDCLMDANPALDRLYLPVTKQEWERCSE